MKMSGEYRIPASRQTVWEALNDPDILRACIPGCETLEKTSETELTAKVTIKIGPVKAKFGGKVTLSDLDPPNGYSISGEGQGGPAGFAKGGAKVTLEEDGDGTILRYTAEAQVGGKLAQIGQRLIDGSANKLAGQFFAKFAETVGASATESAPAKDQPAPATATREKPKGLPAPVWITGLVALVIVILAVIVAT
jgi:carbon monoxide dehydrogenase subunit G